MKTVFEASVRDELITRIRSLKPDNKALWGKMNASQMLKHCRLAEELYHGKTRYRRMLLGRIIGHSVLKRLIRDETPLGKNAPTSSYFVVKEGGDWEAEKEKLIGLVEEYQDFTKSHIIHWFFGKMKREQIGIFAYKHLDHHLRQFGV